MAGIFISCFPIFPPNMSGISVAWSTCGSTGRQFESAFCRSTLTSPQWSMTAWVNRGLGMFNRVCATGHMKDPWHLSKKGGHRVPVVGFLLVSFIK